jgi:(E)-2-((N-methylformamido)methylene)succinate hydrolase
MPIAQLSQGATFYELSGRGFPLVLVHGMGGDASLWNWHAERLGDRFRVLRYDIIGHGRSAALPGPWRFGQFARQHADLLDHLGIERAAVCGFSLGGNIGQGFALDYPARTAALVVVSSACARTAEEQAKVDVRVEQVRAGGPPAVVEGALSRWFGPDYAAAHPEVIAYWRAKTLANDPQCYRLSGIAAPTLILTGDQDAGQTPRMAAEMARRIGTPDLIVLPGIRHMLPLEAGPALVDAIAKFLARCGLAEAR